MAKHVTGNRKVLAKSMDASVPSASDLPAARFRVFRGESAASPPDELRRTKPLSLRQAWAALTGEEQAAVLRLAAMHAQPARITELHSKHSTRPPDWRWQGAIYWLQQGLPPWPDHLTGEFFGGVRLLMAVAPNGVACPDCLGVDPRLVEAYKAFLATNAKDLRISAETLILAGLSPEEVATELKLPTRMVIAFEYLWFDVRDRLDRPSAITHFVIGTPSPKESLTDAMARERKRLAYFGGELVAREFNRVVVDMPKPTSLEGVEAFLDADVKRHIERQGHLLLRCLDPSIPKHARMLLRLFTRLQLAETRSERKHEHAQLNQWNRSGDLTTEESKKAIQQFLHHTQGIATSARRENQTVGQPSEGNTTCHGNHDETAIATTTEPPVRPPAESANTLDAARSPSCVPILT